MPEGQVSGTVDKICRITTGDLLIVLIKEILDNGHCFQQTIAGLLEDEAELICKGPQEDLEIRNLDEEIHVALQKATGEACGITVNAVKSLREAYGGTQTASVTLAASMVKDSLGEHGKIRMG